MGRKTKKTAPRRVVIDRQITVERKDGVIRTFPTGWTGEVSAEEWAQIEAAEAGHEPDEPAESPEAETDWATLTLDGLAEHRPDLTRVLADRVVESLTAENLAKVRPDLVDAIGKDAVSAAAKSSPAGDAGMSAGGKPDAGKAQDGGGLPLGGDEKRAGG